MVVEGFNQDFLRKSTDSTRYNAIEDYSGAAVRYILAPAAGQLYRVKKLIITIQDDDGDYNKYGNLSTLSNGVQLVKETSDGTLIQALLGGVAIKKAEDWDRVADEVRERQDGSDAIRSTVFEIVFETPVLLRADDSERLAVILNDNFSTLEGHTFFAEFEAQRFF